MDSTFRDILWRQFGAAIDMLDNALAACPDELWGDRSRRPKFWYLAFHTLFLLDLYLSESDEGFAPPPPFTLSEMEDGVMPDRVYTRDELRDYLQHGRRKCRAVIDGLTDDESARAEHRFAWIALPRLEMLLYNLRHVQHHAAQLNLILRQETDSAPRWVRAAR